MAPFSIVVQPGMCYALAIGLIVKGCGLPSVLEPVSSMVADEVTPTIAVGCGLVAATRTAPNRKVATSHKVGFIDY